MVYFPPPPTPPLKENLVVAEKKTLVVREWYWKRLCKQAETYNESYAVTLTLIALKWTFQANRTFTKYFACGKICLNFM